VTVDPHLCELAGYCEKIAETVFSLHNEPPLIRVDMEIVRDTQLVALVL
jgi:ferredoxin